MFQRYSILWSACIHHLKEPATCMAKSVQCQPGTHPYQSITALIDDITHRPSGQVPPEMLGRQRKRPTHSEILCHSSLAFWPQGLPLGRDIYQSSVILKETS